MPDGVELPPDNLVEGLEEALVNGEVLDIDLVGPPELLDAMDARHGVRHGDADVDDLRRGALEVGGGEDVEARPEVEAADVEALHGALGLGEAGDHGVGAVGEGVDGEEAVLAQEAGDEGVCGDVGGAVGGEEEQGPDAGGEEVGGEEVGGEHARGEEERRALPGGVERAAVGGGDVGGHVVDLQELGFDQAAPDLVLERVRGGEDEEASAAPAAAGGGGGG